MASSNRHWPSMFKSKHCNAHHLQWQHDANPNALLSSSCHRAEERAPEPKPRWNPRPEQIRILEAIFNSGMVNPPRDEIRRIRAQLQEYGQVGDANVFYWFQNRKSRSKHKLRHLQAQRQQQQQRPSNLTQTTVSLPTSSSSSSSERSNSTKATATVGSPSAATTVHASAELCGEPLVAYLSSLMDGGAQWSDMVSSDACRSVGQGKIDLENPYSTAAAAVSVASEALATVVTTTTAPPSAITNSIICGTQGAGGEDEEGVVGDTTSTRSLLVFINDVAFEMAADRLNVRAAFGEAAVLLHSSGQPVLVDQWGLTLQPLEHGASYYLV